ncbi:MAG: immunoglobulin domain-containing protein [Ignavibacteria bacterium]|nr:immunoglobulin domain-containing protein [Ignavibacteria bacterium]
MSRNATVFVSLLVAVLLFGGLLVQPAYSQGTFGYTVSNGIYSESFGGTVLASGSGISGFEGTVNIGFTYTYGGVAYTTVYVNGNGYVTFGAAGNSGNATPLSSPNSATAVISAWGAAISGATGAELRSELTGGAGSRVLTLQWKNVTRAPAGSSLGLYNFQIKLREGSNNAEIMYGAMNIAGAKGAEIGTYSLSNGIMAFRTRYEENTWSMPKVVTASPYYSQALEGFGPASGLTYSILARVANDAGIVGISNPTKYNADVSQNVQIRVRNWGSNNLDSVIIDWKVNGATLTAVKYYPQPAMAPGTENTITIGSVSFAANTFNTIWVGTLAPNGQTDARTSNDAHQIYSAPRVTGKVNIAANGNPGVFPNIRECVRHLSVAGIGGNVDAHIFNGTYNEQVIIPSFDNSLAGGTVTFMSAANNTPKITWTPSNNPSWTYSLAGACRAIATLDLTAPCNTNFKNLVFELPNGQNWGGFIYGDIRGGTVNIENCTFNGPNNFLTMTNPFVGLYLFDKSNFGTINVLGNTVNNYPSSMELDGSDQTVVNVRNNTCNNTRFGLYSEGAKIDVSNNKIYGTSGYTYFYGVVVISVNGSVANNQIYGDVSATAQTTTYGIQTVPDNGNLLVTNNMIGVGASANTYGIANLYAGTSAGTAQFYHNTVNTTGTAVSAATSAFYNQSLMESYPNSAVELVNNIFHSVGTGTNGGYAIRLDDAGVINNTTSNPLKTSDFNDLYTSGTNVGFWKNVNVPKVAGINPLSTWRTTSARDNNSAAVAATFYGSGDLNLLNIIPALWGSGSILAIVPKDIDGETRTKPYMGADEVRPSIRFVQQPVSRYACLGESFNLIAIAEVTVGATVTYQWFKDGVELTGQTGAILSFGGVGYQAAGVFTCLVKASDGTNNVQLMSDAASIIVVHSTTIIVCPASKPVASGSTVILEMEAEAIGGPSNFNPTYQWKKRYWSPTSVAYLDSNVTDNGRITGSNSNRLTIREIGRVDTLDQYVCVVTGYCGSATTKSARLFIPTIAASNNTPNVCLGGVVQIECSAIPGVVPGATVSYQWQKNGVNVSDDANTTGSMTKVLTIGNASAAANGDYTCVAKYGVDGDPIPSNTITVTLSNPVAITGQPDGDTLCVGSELKITVTASGSNTSYQWMKGTTSIPGAIANVFTVASATANDAGTYSVVVTNSCGGVTSGTVDVFVNTKPEITTEPTNAAVTEGNEIKFSVVASGTATLTYQWYKNDTSIAGATTATYTIASAVGSDTGSYRCIVTNGCGSDTSATVEASVVVGVDGGDITMGAFMLGVSSPNPTADVVRFNYSTPTSQFVKIAVTNVLGRELTTLVNGFVDAGTHPVEFSTQGLNLSPGIYSYTITSNGFVATQQFVVTR